MAYTTVCISSNSYLKPVSYLYIAPNGHRHVVRSRLGGHSIAWLYAEPPLVICCATQMPSLISYSIKQVIKQVSIIVRLRLPKAFRDENTWSPYLNLPLQASTQNPSITVHFGHRIDQYSLSLGIPTYPQPTSSGKFPARPSIPCTPNRRKTPSVRRVATPPQH